MNYKPDPKDIYIIQSIGENIKVTDTHIFIEGDPMTGTKDRWEKRARNLEEPEETV